MAFPKTSEKRSVPKKLVICLKPQSEQQIGAKNNNSLRTADRCQKN